MRLKVSDSIEEGTEVYHIKNIDLCEIFAKECGAYNSEYLLYFWGEYRESTCFRLINARNGGGIRISYSPLAFYIKEKCNIVEYKPRQRSE